MARVSKQEKQISHDKIVAKAAFYFRENGIESTGIADVMKAAGFTHGGFYRHFASKNDLVCAAIDVAFKEITNRVESSIAQAGPKKALEDYVSTYLSPKHVEMLGAGCPIAALGVEAGRLDSVLNVQFELGLEKLIGLLAQGIEGDTKNARALISRLLFSLVGTLILARAAPSKAKMLVTLSNGQIAAKQLLQIP